MTTASAKTMTVPLWAGVAGGVAMLLMWGSLMFALALAGEMLLVPWDLYSVQARPPLGSLARTLNDTFETGMGALMLCLLPLGIQVAALVVGLRRRDGWVGARLALRCAGLIGLLLLAIAAVVILRPVGLEPGYDKTWHGIVVMLLALLWFVLAHRRLLRPRL